MPGLHYGDMIDRMWLSYECILAPAPWARTRRVPKADGGFAFATIQTTISHRNVTETLPDKNIFPLLQVLICERPPPPPPGTSFKPRSWFHREESPGRSRRRKSPPRSRLEEVARFPSPHCNTCSTSSVATTDSYRYRKLFGSSDVAFRVSIVVQCYGRQR